MNKKGFTLVELMGVIAVMAVLIVVVATNGFGVFNKAKSGINKIEEDNLLEGARVFLVDVDNHTDANTFVKVWPDGCNKESFINNYCEVTVQYLEDNTYFNDKGNKCDGTKKIRLEIIQDASGNTTDYIAKKVSSDVICEN